MRVLGLLIIAAAIVLAALNPDMNDFAQFAEEQSEQLIRQETGDSEWGDILSGVGSRLAAGYIQRITDRKNYIFFSTYTIDLDGPESQGEEWRFLGIADHFLELERPASLRDGNEEGQ